MTNENAGLWILKCAKSKAFKCTNAKLGRGLFVAPITFLVERFNGDSLDVYTSLMAFTMTLWSLMFAADAVDPKPTTSFF